MFAASSSKSFNAVNENIPSSTAQRSLGEQSLDWYVLESKRFRESFAARQLRAIGIETYVPMFTEVAGGFVNKRPEPLFSGYVFAMTEVSKVVIVERVPGIKRVVRLGGDLATIEKTAIEALKRQENNQGLIESHRSFIADKAYQIAVGPLRGERAIVRGNAVRHGRIRVLISLLRREVAVDVAVGWLREL
jgi:transcription antitermination factor NusG